MKTWNLNIIRETLVNIEKNGKVYGDLKKDVLDYVDSCTQFLEFLEKIIEREVEYKDSLLPGSVLIPLSKFRRHPAYKDKKPGRFYINAWTGFLEVSVSGLGIKEARVYTDKGQDTIVFRNFEELKELYFPFIKNHIRKEVEKHKRAMYDAAKCYENLDSYFKV